MVASSNFMNLIDQMFQIKSGKKSDMSVNNRSSINWIVWLSCSAHCAHISFHHGASRIPHHSGRIHFLDILNENLEVCVFLAVRGELLHQRWSKARSRSIPCQDTQRRGWNGFFRPLLWWRFGTTIPPLIDSILQKCHGVFLRRCEEPHISQTWLQLWLLQQPVNDCTGPFCMPDLLQSDGGQNPLQSKW